MNKCKVRNYPSIISPIKGLGIKIDDFYIHLKIQHKCFDCISYCLEDCDGLYANHNARIDYILLNEQVNHSEFPVRQKS
jgi:hypothetical protein